MTMRHLIFDFDGTLVDSAPAILAGFDAVLKRAGLTPAQPLTKKLIGPPLLATLSRVTGSSDPKLLGALADDFKSYYDDEGLRFTEAYDGIGDSLAELARRGFSLHLATNKRWRPTEKILKMFGWEELFASTYAQDKGPLFASKAEMLKTLLAEQGLSPAATVYIGDTPEDGQAAAANDLFFAAVMWGYGNFDNWEEVGGMTRIPSPAALVERIDAIAPSN